MPCSHYVMSLQVYHSALNQLPRRLAVIGDQLLDIQPLDLPVDHSPLPCNHHPIRTVCTAQQQR